MYSDNLAGSAYLWPVSPSWTTRPGVDLDAGIRVRRSDPLSQWPVIDATRNQYTVRAIAALLPPQPGVIFARARLLGIKPGPLAGLQPETEAARWPYSNVSLGMKSVVGG